MNQPVSTLTVGVETLAIQSCAAAASQWWHLALPVSKLNQYKTRLKLNIRKLVFIDCGSLPGESHFPHSRELTGLSAAQNPEVEMIREAPNENVRVSCFSIETIRLDVDAGFKSDIWFFWTSYVINHSHHSRVCWHFQTTLISQSFSSCSFRPQLNKLNELRLTGHLCLCYINLTA